jgi:branched-chain amino acid transport system permease protein
VAALGFTLMWQAAGVINFAQGEFVMLPAFGMLACIAAGMPLWLAFLVTCALAALVLGYAFKRGIADPLIHHGVIPLVIATLGVSIAAKSIVRSGYSAMAQQFPSPFPEGVFHVAGVTVSYADAGTLVIAGAIVLSLQAFLNRTVTGRAMQAVAQNTEAARVLGIDVSRMVLYVFVINALLACVAALLITPIYLAKFDMGDTIGAKAFFAAIIGGFNQTRGALLGGILIGIMENVVGFYLSPAYKEGVALVLFLLVILFRPEGILGRREERKV